MNRIVVTEPLNQQLRGLIEPCELFDPAGNRLGYFRPDADRSLYDGLDSEETDEELTRRECAGGGRRLADILADLERQHG